MSDQNEKAVSLFTASISALVDVVVSGRARSARIRYTDPNGPSLRNFWWISVDKIETAQHEEPKLFAATNDLDLMCGAPPSFHKSVPLSSASELVDATVAFLTEKLGTAAKVDILLQADAPLGQPAIPAYVGNSDDGFENLMEQSVPDIF
jgi:hypothetical protein